MLYMYSCTPPSPFPGDAMVAPDNGIEVPRQHSIEQGITNQTHQRDDSGGEIELQEHREMDGFTLHISSPGTKQNDNASKERRSLSLPIRALLVSLKGWFRTMLVVKCASRCRIVKLYFQTMKALDTWLSGPSV